MDSGRHDAVGFVIIHVLLPYAISRLSVRHGWIGGHPGPLNLLALLLVAAGAVGIAWAAWLHVAEMSAASSGASARAICNTGTRPSVVRPKHSLREQERA